MIFSYKARTKSGELQVGTVEGDSRDAAANVLLHHGLFVLSLEEERENKVGGKITAIFNRVRSADLMVFTRQFATLVASQVPLSDAISNLYHQTKNAVLKEAIAEIADDIEAGLSLSQAFQKQPNIFSEFFVNMIRSAEVTGRLSEVLEFMADYLETQAELVSKVRNALTYPAFLLGLFVVVVVIVVTVVLPQIKPIFEESSVAIPAFTKAMLGLGDFIQAWWWAVLIILGMFGIMIFDYFGSKEGRTVRDELVLRLPVLGTLFKKMYLARFAESAMILIRGGLTIPQAVEISSRTVGNAVYQELLHRAADQVRKGRILSEALAEMDEFPPLVAQLVGVGESTGRLEQLLEKVRQFYTREVNDMVDNLVNLLQPILMIIIGIVVAVLFASILLPIYGLVQSF